MNIRLFSKTEHKSIDGIWITQEVPRKIVVENELFAAVVLTLI